MLEREFQKKRKIRSRIYSKTTVAVLLIVIILLAHATWKVYKTKVESGKNFEKVSADLEEMRTHEAELTAGIDRLNTEKGTEEEIRKKFNVAKEGEGVVYVVEKPENKKQEVDERGFFGKMWGGLIDFF